jgi:hypothetical protein
LGTTGPGVLELAESTHVRFLDRLFASMRAGAWIFILLAAAEAALNARSQIVLLGAIQPSTSNLVDLAAVAIAGPMKALLPAAVLFWRPNAWRTAPMLMAGSVLWTATGPASLEARWLISDLQSSGTEFALLVSGAPLAGALASRFGGLIVIVGLERTRTLGRAAWPPILVLATAGVLVLLSIPTISTQLSYYEALRSGGNDYPLWTMLTLESATEWVDVLLLVGVVWSTLSAVRAGEPPRPMWRLVLAGSVLLLMVVATAHQQGVGIQALGYGDIDYGYYGWLSPWLNPANALGATLLTAGFVVAALPARRPTD